MRTVAVLTLLFLPATFTAVSLCIRALHNRAAELMADRRYSIPVFSVSERRMCGPYRGTFGSFGLSRCRSRFSRLRFGLFGRRGVSRITEWVIGKGVPASLVPATRIWRCGSVSVLSDLCFLTIYTIIAFSMAIEG